MAKRAVKAKPEQAYTQKLYFLTEVLPDAKAGSSKVLR